MSSRSFATSLSFAGPTPERREVSPSVLTDINADGGAALAHELGENALFATLLANDFFIKGYALFDARVGVTSDDDHWRVSLYGRNLSNKTYTTAISTYLDTLIRYRGKHAVYGVSAAYSF